MNFYKVCWVVLGATAFSGVANAASYKLIDLRDLAGGLDSSSALSINDSNTVVGWGRDATGQRAVEWDAGNMTALLPAASTAYAINNSGQIVGTSGSPVHGYAYNSDNSVKTDLGDLPGGSNFSFAASINAQGTAVGYSIGFINGSSGATTTRAVMWQGNTMTQLGSLNDGTSNPGYASFAQDINDSGTIVGYSSAAGGNRAVVWNNGSMTDLGVLAGETSSRAFAVNADGIVVGSSGSYATLWENGTVQKIESFAAAAGAATAYDINAEGLVVGQVRVNGGNAAFLWEETVGMVSFNDLLLNADGWNVTDARSINSLGWVAATATFNGISHAVVLQPIPVPEPASWAMLAGGLAALGAVGRRKRLKNSVRAV